MNNQELAMQEAAKLFKNQQSQFTSGLTTEIPDLDACIRKAVIHHFPNLPPDDLDVKTALINEELHNRGDIKRRNPLQKERREPSFV